MCQDMPKLCLSLAFEALSNLSHRPAQFHLLDPLPSSPLFLPCTQSYRTHAAHTGCVLWPADPFPWTLCFLNLSNKGHLCCQTLHPPSLQQLHFNPPTLSTLHPPSNPALPPHCPQSQLITHLVSWLVVKGPGPLVGEWIPCSHGTGPWGQTTSLLPPAPTQPPLKT